MNTGAYEHQLQHDPATLLNVIVENNAEAVAHNLKFKYNMLTDGTQSGIISALQNLTGTMEVDEAARCLVECLSVAIIPENLNDVGRGAVYNTAFKITGGPVSRNMILDPESEFQNQWGGDWGDIGGESSPADQDNPNNNWGTILTGLGNALPGVLELFGFGADESQTASNQDFMNQWAAQQAAQQAQNRKLIIGIGIAVILILIIYFLVNRFGN